MQRSFMFSSSRRQFLYLTSSVLVAAKNLEVQVEKSKNIESNIILIFLKKKGCNVVSDWSRFFMLFLINKIFSLTVTSRRLKSQCWWT